MKFWDVEKMHRNCKDCSDLVASAIAQANSNDAQRAVSTYVEQGNVDNVLHRAEVTRK